MRSMNNGDKAKQQFEDGSLHLRVRASLAVGRRCSVPNRHEQPQPAIYDTVMSDIDPIQTAVIVLDVRSALKSTLQRGSALTSRRLWPNKNAMGRILRNSVHQLRHSSRLPTIRIPQDVR